MSQKLKLSSGFELVSLDFIVSHEIVGGMCNLLGSVWSQQKFELTDGPVLQLSFWQATENISSRHEGRPTQKKRREERGSILTPFYMYFLLLLSLPCVNWASQQSCLFHLRFSLRSLDLPLFYFCRLFLFFIF